MKRAIKLAVCWLWQRRLISFRAGHAALVAVDATEA
jgi:hypothetical protein